MGSPLYGAGEISVPFLIKTKDFESTFRHIEVYFPELTNSDNAIGQYFVQKRSNAYFMFFIAVLQLSIISQHEEHFLENRYFVW